jgi:hypothetical protein
MKISILLAIFGLFSSGAFAAETWNFCFSERWYACQKLAADGGPAYCSGAGSKMTRQAVQPNGLRGVWKKRILSSNIIPGTRTAYDIEVVIEKRPAFYYFSVSQRLVGSQETTTLEAWVDSLDSLNEFALQGEVAHLPDGSLFRGGSAFMSNKNCRL